MLTFFKTSTSRSFALILETPEMFIIPACAGHRNKFHYGTTWVLIKRNQGDELNLKTLSGKFAMHMPIIERDLMDRLASPHLWRVKDWCLLDARHLVRLNFLDLELIAGLASAHAPSVYFSDKFFRTIFDGHPQLALLFGGHSPEAPNSRQNSFWRLVQVIPDELRMGLTCQKSADPNFCTRVEPFRWIILSGFQDLATGDGFQFQAYACGKIDGQQIGNSTLKPDLAINAGLWREGSAWLSRNETELEMDSVMDGYFPQHKRIASLAIEQGFKDEDLIACHEVAFTNRVFSFRANGCPASAPSARGGCSQKKIARRTHRWVHIDSNRADRTI